MKNESLTFIVITCNEERNLRECLNRVAGWASEIFVVDSGSTDATPTIAAEFGATFVGHEFVTHARQWSWALAELPVKTEWILALDADQRVTTELRRAIDLFIAGAADGVHGAFVRRRQVFRGKWIRHGGYYPKYLLKLFRAGTATADESDLVDHHFSVRGSTVNLAADIVEDNRNEREISVWIHKHLRYAALQAQEEHRRRKDRAPVAVRARLFGNPDERMRWFKAKWERLPLFIRPVIYFIYRYVLRLGFLDGREGFVFHFLQGFWYRLMVDVNLSDLRKGREQIKQGLRSGSMTESCVSRASTGRHIV